MPATEPNEDTNCNAAPPADTTEETKILEAYEKTMISCIQQVDELKAKLAEIESEKVELIRERDQALEDLRNVESAFSDVHRKYERSKGLLENCRMNEEILKKRDEEMQEKISNRDRKIEGLKEKVQESLEQMHQNYEGRLKEVELENAKLRVLLRKTEMKVDTLENDVEQKSREVKKLNTLCDELISGKLNEQSL